MGSIIKNKKMIFIVGAIIAVIAIVVSTLIGKNVYKSSKNLDSETLRSMSYGELTEEDAKVENCDYV